MNSLGIWLITNDLRLNNEALAEALNECSTVLPLFIWDEKIRRCSANSNKASFYNEAVKDLRKEISRLNGQIITIEGDTQEILLNLQRKYNFKKIYCQQNVNPKFNDLIKRISTKFDIKTYNTSYVSDFNNVVKDDGSPFLTFSSFARGWFKKDNDISSKSFKITKFKNIEVLNENNFKPPLNRTPFKGSSNFAEKKLGLFIENNIKSYQSKRNRLDLDGTSMISAYINSGMLDIKHVFNLAINAGNNSGVNSWVNELLWREFNAYIMFHFPDILDSSFKNKLQNYPWEKNNLFLDYWKNGLTGYSCVDACMRQLLELGWMHNRGRMIVASFLTKDLFIHWKEGEKWFMENLVDADTPSNVGGWQWTAGTGVDAAPYFRIFNPILQGKKFDPKGIYIKKWIPELRNIDTKYIHDPSSYDLDLSYPKQIVLHEDSRKKALFNFNLEKY